MITAIEHEREDLSEEAVQRANLCPHCQEFLDHNGPQPDRLFLGLNFRPEDAQLLSTIDLVGSALASSRGLDNSTETIYALIFRLWLADQGIEV